MIVIPYKVVINQKEVEISRKGVDVHGKYND